MTWERDGYHCDTCGCSLHCAKCNDGGGAQGHLVVDDEGSYFHCEEPERWARQREALLAIWNRKTKR